MAGVWLLLFSALTVVSLIVFVVGIVTLAVPMPALGIPTRERAAAVTFFSFVGWNWFGVLAFLNGATVFFFR